jgi:hypothetical protein
MRLTNGACMAFENLLACRVISSCSSRAKVANWSYLVPIRTGIAVCGGASTTINARFDF